LILAFSAMLINSLRKSDLNLASTELLVESLWV
jgi:hypothetical protein